MEPNKQTISQVQLQLQLLPSPQPLPRLPQQQAMEPVRWPLHHHQVCTRYRAHSPIDENELLNCQNLHIIEQKMYFSLIHICSFFVAKFWIGRFNPRSTADVALQSNHAHATWPASNFTLCAGGHRRPDGVVSRVLARRRFETTASGTRQMLSSRLRV